ncbi:MAG: hypothetical protein HYR91_07670 [Flavobacteriia bacterium]|nr:hypothetical protein [Flavobacteriia bacterium]
MKREYDTIDDIIQTLTDIIEQCKSENSRLGYFAVLYRDVTIQVKNKIKEGFFEDGPRMEKLDVVFAKRYLDAYFDYKDGKKISYCWKVAFNVKNKPLIILQHLLLGMNAHINYDLAIATAEVAPGDKLPAIHNDFNKIMDILSSMIDDVQERIEKVSPSLKIIDKIGGRTDEKIAGFVIDKARDLAWLTAEKLVSETTEKNIELLQEHDEIVTNIGNSIIHPGFILSIGYYFIRRKESKNVCVIIDTLSI